MKAERKRYSAPVRPACGLWFAGACVFAAALAVWLWWMREG